MPAAVAVPAALSAAGIGAGAAGGKKAQNAANQQLGLQKQQFGLTQQQVGLGNKALGGATNYWQALLNGSGNAAQQATGPYASLIGQNAQGARTAIQALTPRGGEQNLALAQNYNTASNNIARLYAGMQPLAAQNLQGIGQAYMGSAAGFNPTANTGGAMNIYGQEMAGGQQAGAGFGQLLYNALQNRGGKSSGGGLNTGNIGAYSGSGAVG